jgi:oligoribonuclease
MIMSQALAGPQPVPALPAGESNPPATPNESLLIWVDMEMTGLRPDVDRIIEVAVVITDNQLRPLVQSEAYAIHQPDTVLDSMDDWNRNTHGRSGLTTRVRESAWTEAGVEQALIDFISRWVPSGKSPMCGNSVCQDRRFMARYMPRLESWFHYRNLDVSTVKELCRRWAPETARRFGKRGAHTALADILESIEEMRFYRDHFIGASPLARLP